MSAGPGQGRPRGKPHARSHRRVEQARQELVNAEEAYLTVSGWSRAQIGDAWMWQVDVAGVRIVMTRVEAVKLQHYTESKR